jgi:hypothetical protein
MGLSRMATFILLAIIINDHCGLDRKRAGRKMGKKKKKQRKETQTDAEKILEEDKAYSTMEREQDF